MPKIKTLKNKLDKLFSEFIRKRDSVDGWGTCVTCNKNIQAFGGEGHCGHFMSRRHFKTRCDPLNAKLQCNYCNTFCAGLQFEFGKALDEEHGEGTADLIQQLSRVQMRLTVGVLEGLIEEFKGALDE